MGKFALAMWVLGIILRGVKEWGNLSDENQARVLGAIQLKFASRIGDGEIIKFIWDNRDEILEFVLTIIGLFGGTEEVSVLSEADAKVAALIAACE